MRLALLLHLAELACVEVRGFDAAPIVGGGIHGEAGTQGTVYAHDDVVLAGPAVPLLKLAMHEFAHIDQPLHRIDHLVAHAVLGNDPIDQLIDLREILGTDESSVVLNMLEVRLVNHRRLIDVVIGGNAMGAGNLGKPLHVFEVVAADVDIEEDRLAVIVLPTDEIIKVLADGIECFGETMLLIHGVNGEVENCRSGISQLVDHLRAQQAPIGWYIDPKTLLHCVVNYLVNELRTKERLTAHRELSVGVRRGAASARRPQDFMRVLSLLPTSAEEARVSD